MVMAAVVTASSLPCWQAPSTSPSSLSQLAADSPQLPDSAHGLSEKEGGGHHQHRHHHAGVTPLPLALMRVLQAAGVEVGLASAWVQHRNVVAHR